MADKKSFDYTYSAKEHEEIVEIQRKYGINRPKPSSQEATLEELRRLDRSTTRPGVIVGLVIGILGTLIMGTGMSMAMVWSDRLFVQGIIIGVAGMAVAATAYPIYKAVTKRRKVQNAPKIRELSDKLLGEEY